MNSFVSSLGLIISSCENLIFFGGGDFLDEWMKFDVWLNLLCLRVSLVRKFDDWIYSSCM